MIAYTIYKTGYATVKSLNAILLLAWAPLGPRLSALDLLYISIHTRGQTGGSASHKQRPTVTSREEARFLGCVRDAC